MEIGSKRENKIVLPISRSIQIRDCNTCFVKQYQLSVDWRWRRKRETGKLSLSRLSSFSNTLWVSGVLKSVRVAIVFFYNPQCVHVDQIHSVWFALSCVSNGNLALEKGFGLFFLFVVFRGWEGRSVLGKRRPKRIGRPLFSLCFLCVYDFR